MAYQLLALYHHPESASAFDKHYDEVHAPLAARLPGLRAYTATRPAGNDPAYHLVAVLTFDDEAAFNAAMGSDVGQQAVADLANFAGGGVTMLTGPAATVV
ncbi:EthD family reductase [Nonomuraea sp. MCN248]|uniref:EthD family reductase n=1 Tax=Nonomuraea corallina TaxID=2989783 RepID=A0ABT4SI18_9ACTN|nr:EthD family reductase [Nonomuraea corallina]MDA0636867.1 EthD family reductase [Nonomuraea corallina]